MKQYRTLVEYFMDYRGVDFCEWSKDMVITGGDTGRIEMTFTTEATRHANRLGGLHGGAFATFSDCLMGASCFTCGKSVVTLELKGNFVKGVKAGETVYGVGQVEHDGRRTMVTTSRIYNSEGELLYIGGGTFFVIGDLELPNLPWR